MRQKSESNCITQGLKSTTKGKGDVSEKSGSATASKSKTSSDAKPAASKSEPSASSKDASSASDSSTEKSTKSSTEKSTESGTEKSTESGTEKSAKSSADKSQKQTVSTSDVHYGYFSSVRTPAYRKGWDDIFAKKKPSGAKARKNGASVTATKKKKAALKKPITLELDIGELPDELRAALSNEVRRKVKRRRVNYDKLDKAGAVRWNIVCEIER